MNYLNGTIIPKDKLSVGMKVIYLLEKDIDKSGRGYYFPRVGTTTNLDKRTIDFDDRQEFTSLSNLRECVEFTEENKSKNFSS